MKRLTFSINRSNLSGSRKVRKGFSIVEVAIAMGVVTLLLTTFLGVFGSAQNNIQRALSTKDANRMKDTLSNEMSILRNNETGTYSGAFDKAFNMIGGSHTEDSAVLIYQYRGDTNSSKTSGILNPYVGDHGIQGKDYIMQTAVRLVGNRDLQAELEQVEGPVFVVRMTQLVKAEDEDGNAIGLWAWNSSGVLREGITDPDSPDTAIGSSTDYPKAVIAFKAEFFRLKSNNFDYINEGNWDFDNIGNAVTEVNMAIRR